MFTLLYVAPLLFLFSVITSFIRIWLEFCWGLGNISETGYYRRWFLECLRLEWIMKEFAQDVQGDHSLQAEQKLVKYFNSYIWIFVDLCLLLLLVATCIS